jgi:Aerotolerance regulator N-terminal/von Willebrand factor type A domain/Beta-galactosidase trimerisation domain/CARDB
MFGLPSMLWWAAAAAVPILIHLFARQRFRRVQWAAMEFLKRAFQKTKRRIRIENLLLLLLRVAALVLLALALADPRVKSSMLEAGPDARRDVVVILDDSFSMGYRETSGETPFRRAHDQALKLVRSLRNERGDLATLITAGKPAALRLSRTDPDRVAAEIDRVEIADSPTDLAAALRVVLSVLDRRGVEVFLFTDLQRVAIMPPDDDDSAATATRPADAGKPSQIIGTLLDQIRSLGGRVSVVPAGIGDADNLAVTDVRVTSKVAVINQPVKFSATVRNFGQRPASGVLNLFVDGTESGVESQTIDPLAPGATHAADFQHTFREAGPHEVDVRFTTDALEVDNRRALSTLVEKRLGVLVVDGSPNPDPGEEASFFLKTALELGASQTRPPVFQVKTVTDVTFDQENLAEWDLVALANVASVSEKRAQELEEFVARGGGLLVFLGEQTAAVRMNDLLYKEGKGVLPAAIGSPVGEVDTRVTAFEIKPLATDRPPFDYFADDRIRAALIGVPIYRFFSVTLPEKAADVRVLAQFEATKAAVTPPSPAVIEKTFGRGRTILVTTSADRDWNDLAVFPTYVPFIRETAYHLVRRPERFENLLVGDSYRRDLERFVQDIVLERGGKQLEVIKPVTRPGGAGFEVRIDEPSKLGKAGVYRLVYVDAPDSAEKPLRSTYVAVNVDTRESDLTRVKPEALSGLFTADQLRVVETVDAETGGRAAPDENSWWWLTLLVLMALVGESALAQLFGRQGRGGGVS